MLIPSFSKESREIRARRKKDWVRPWPALRFIYSRVQMSAVNVFRDRRYRREVLDSTAPLTDLTRYERSVFSQNGEDGILAAIFARIGTATRSYVEFGVENGEECNTRYLREQCGWAGLQMDGAYENSSRGLVRAYVTAENLEALFEQHNVPREVDLVCIDVDGNDLWLWRALSTRWRPRVVIVEYNASLGPEKVASVPYSHDFHWPGTDYFGCSLAALVRLARVKGYTLVACDSLGVNAFFVRNDLVAGAFVEQTVQQLYRPPRYGRRYPGHPPDPHRQVPELSDDVFIEGGADVTHTMAGAATAPAQRSAP